MMMARDNLRVVGAREHNLKNITVEIPRDQLVVITGLSGSGKSSLAFDTIFAEGQRRYVESLSAYARQFLGQMSKPDVDTIEGLSPAVSIDQKATSHNPRSTVGTVTEVYDYLRLLYARVGIPHCPVCGRVVQKQSAQEIVEDIEKLPEGSRLQILSPLVRERKGTYQAVFEEIRKAGFVRVRVDGETHTLEDEFNLDRYKKHTIEAVVDRLILRAPEDDTEAQAARSRMTDSVETALKFGDGYVTVQNLSGRPAPRHPVLRAPGLPRTRQHHHRDRAAHLFLQHPPRRLPHLPGPGQPPGDRPGPADPGPLRLPGKRRHRRQRLGRPQGRRRLLLADAGSRSPALQNRPGSPRRNHP